MTKPQSTGTDVLTRMIAQIDAERIGALSEEELFDEMRDADLEPERPVDVEKWMDAADQAQRAAAPTCGKHGIAFEEAVPSFADPLALVADDLVRPERAGRCADA